MYLFSLILTSFVLSRVLGTLTPSGSVSIDCGGQRTFTCAVPGVAAWTITGLTGIAATSSPAGGIVGARVTTTSLVLAPTSTITIAGFNTSDNGGTVQCVDISAASSVEGVATIAVVSTTLASATAVMADGDQCIAANLSWSEPSDSSGTTSVSCEPSSPQCSSCTSSGCTIEGLNSSTSYTFSVTRSRSGCDDSTAMSSPVMSGGIPSCPTNFLVTDRSTDFSSATITWEQPINSPPVTSYNVTCNSSCPDMPCSSGPSTCRVLSVSPCEDYSVTVLPMNSCGSSICTGNTVPMPAQGIPECGQLDVTTSGCPMITFTPGSTNPSTVLVSLMDVSSSAVLELNCIYPIDPEMCKLDVPSGTYTVTVTPQNSCSSPSRACPQYSPSVTITGDCMVVITSPSTNDPAPECPLCWLLLLLLLLIPVVYSICVAVVWQCCYKDYNYCQVYWCCCFCKRHEGKTKSSVSAKRMRSESPVTPPAQPPAQAPADEYADPQAIRDRKEKGKEDKDKIQYAAIDFSAGAGSGAGEVKIHQKEEPVIYTAIQHV